VARPELGGGTDMKRDPEAGAAPEAVSKPAADDGTLTATDISMELVLQGLLESLSEGLIVFDDQLRYVLWSSFMEKLTGVTSDRVLGRQPGRSVSTHRRGGDRPAARTRPRG